MPLSVDVSVTAGNPDGGHIYFKAEWYGEGSGGSKGVIITQKSSEIAFLLGKHDFVFTPTHYQFTQTRFFFASERQYISSSHHLQKEKKSQCTFSVARVLRQNRRRR